MAHPQTLMRTLSKSKLIAFRQCPKRLWLELHRPELKEISAETEARFQVGYQVGDISRRIYDPEGKGAVIDFKTEGFDGAFTRTGELVANSKQPIFEAGFKVKGALAFADVLLPVRSKSQALWRMIEVKSSTSVKDYHREDIAVQTFVAKTAGVPLKSIALAHIDNEWVYPGNEDYRGLLKEEDMTKETVARIKEVGGWIAEAQKTAALTKEPKVAIGEQCHDPFDCPFSNYCNRGIPQPEHPIDWLPRLSSSQREQLAADGVNELRDVPENLLNATQRMVKEHTLAGTVRFDAAGAAADLAPHGLPAYFLDFETVNFAVPIWKGTRPYQQIVVQFSVHALDKSGKLSQAEFLDLSGNDPSEALAKALIPACGTKGPVFVYNANFEKGCIRELAGRFPKLANPLLAINERVVDLLPIARNRYYHHSQQGSWSIKAVLPAAVPELSYEALVGVQHGGAVAEAFAEAIHPGTAAGRKREIERQLLAYCRLDTLAMVRLWEFFKGRNPKG